MATVLLVTYLLIVLALIGVILLQRSEGGGLGMGSSSNGLVSVRGSANLLTRTTAILATLFFAAAIGLTVLSELDNETRGILQQATDGIGASPSTPTNVLDALNQLQSQTDSSLPVPSSGSATPAPSADAPATTSDGTAPAAPPAGQSDLSLAVPAPAETQSGGAAPAN